MLADKDNVPMTNGSALFDTLWIIESLPDGDLKTGRALYETKLVAARAKHENLGTRYETPSSAQELLAVLDKVRESAKQGLHPMVHFECHGSPEGLATASGELIEWDDLRHPLIEINEACGMNLVVVLAACNGAHLINVATRLDKAPFWATIGPEHEVKAGDIEADFGAYYEEFFDSLNGDRAMLALNRNNKDPKRRYHFQSAEGLFLRAYARYYQENCCGKGKQRRIEALLSEVLQNTSVRKLGISVARRLIKVGLVNEEPHFNKKKHEFFLIDRYPDGAKRFIVTFADVLAFPKLRKRKPLLSSS